jgi:hypothetical protein
MRVLKSEWKGGHLRDASRARITNRELPQNDKRQRHQRPDHPQRARQGQQRKDDDGDEERRPQRGAEHVARRGTEASTAAAAVRGQRRGRFRARCGRRGHLGMEKLVVVKVGVRWKRWREDGG